MKALRPAAAATLAVVALAGCVRTTVDTTISADDTFSQHAIVAFSEDLAGQLGAESGVELDGLFETLDDSPELSALEERYPGQIVVEPYDDGELEGVELTITDLPLEEFNSTAEQTASGIGGAATLERVDDQYVIEMASPEGANPESLGISESQLALLSSSVEVSISYTFPGLVEEATVGEIEGRTVTLGITDLASGQDIRIVGGAVDAFDWGSLLRWGGIALALILVIGGALALILQDRRKHRTSSLPPPSTTADPHGPGLLGKTPTDEAGAPGESRIGDVPPPEEGEPGRSQ